MLSSILCFFFVPSDNIKDKALPNCFFWLHCLEYPVLIRNCWFGNTELSSDIDVWHPDFQKLEPLRKRSIKTESDHLQMNCVNRQRLYKVFPSPSGNIIYTVMCLTKCWTTYWDWSFHTPITIPSTFVNELLTCGKFQTGDFWSFFLACPDLFETCWRNQIQNKNICVYLKQMNRSNIKYIVFAWFSLSVFQKKLEDCHNKASQLFEDQDCIQMIMVLPVERSKVRIFPS